MRYFPAPPHVVGAVGDSGATFSFGFASLHAKYVQKPWPTNYGYYRTALFTIRCVEPGGICALSSTSMVEDSGNSTMKTLLNSLGRTQERTRDEREMTPPRGEHNRVNTQG
eukprot:TRINITY_DN167_c0_g2_i5.p5 TRINITY_DN167_c0_g2~~TRINITY_DN167_c0_g2_i5.p5  ORF type:complete len:111 (+),score=5.77 TRINITY_DN167_c0_g2_i5:305-637(+)